MASARREVGDVLTIVVRWGADTLHVAHLSPPQTFLIGESARLPAGFAVPAALLGVQRAPLVRVDREAGEVWLVVVPRANGAARIQGREASLLAWIESGATRPSDDVPGAQELLLGLGSWARVELGELAFEIAMDQEGAPEQPAPLRRPRGGARVVVAAAAALALHAVVLGGAAFAIPVLVDSESFVDTSAEYVFMPAFADIAEREPELAALEVASRDGDDAELVRSRCGHEQGGSMGEPAADDGARHYGVQGPPDNPDPHIGHERRRASPYATDWPPFGTFPAWGYDTEAPFAPFGRDDALGNDPGSARGHMWGDDLGTSFGSPGAGIGLRRLCPTCGAEGRGSRLVLPTSGGSSTGTEPSAAAR